MNKLMSASEAVSIIKDHFMVGIGGNVLHRAPMLLVKELVKQRRKNLCIVKTAGAMDVDLLCFGSCVSQVHAGFISYETELGFANHYRTKVQKGLVKANEHACYTVMCALRAGAMGVGFMPVAGLKDSQLIEVNSYFKKVIDPFSGETVSVVQALRPDITLLHVHAADRQGNCMISGPKYDDILLSRAAKSVIVSAEKIVPDGYFEQNQPADIPGFLVSAVVQAPLGAKPCSCYGEYEIDKDEIAYFKSCKTEDDLATYLAKYSA